ncbi:DUF4982 domain-containing protein [Fulvivirga sp. M361]|uniref:glycoside hydrolase family 2 TIM barrel-domain containing protein n=1 Tax=Fulvivirga sp. M361 TaxID=2594266 RepID=UPI00117A40B3|nr:glycoside hydrolase family 2 TIM barrel-domain containing protein [Fulvivirga sp. M361]TRX59158.1 DUF4982 domain-containing protein [Fulvivirga sp. M361]
MIKHSVSPYIVVIFLTMLGGCSVNPMPVSEQKGRYSYDFNLKWKFNLGDFPGASGVDYPDEDWRMLNLPHDWSIEGDYDSLNPAGPAGGFLPAGIGWYRRYFEWNPEWQNKRVVIEFDGVYCNSTVWINGVELGIRPNGYIGFSYDLTPHLQQGKNLLAVRVDHSKVPSGRWYTGSGIYRNVRLAVMEQLYIPAGGLFIRTPEVDKKSAEVAVDLEVINEVPEMDEIRIIYTITDQNGRHQADNTQVVELVQGENQTQTILELPDPLLWSPDTPNLYYLTVTIASGGKVWDEYQSSFGVRTISFTTENGFLLNGEKTILKGVCNHHDAGPVGAAVPVDVLHRRLKILKNMGCNAIRTSHNPFAPEFYALCDSMGFMVMNEAFDGWEAEKAAFDYGLNFEEWWDKDLEAFIKRDRNHPSVIIWSIGNEVKKYTDATQRKLTGFVKKLDNTRPITQGRGYNGPAVDLAGFNGHGEYRNGLKHFHEKNPTKPIVGTEITHGMQTRGIYRTKTQYRRRDYPAPWEIGKPFSGIAKKVFLVEDLTDEELFADINPLYHSSYDNSIVRMSIRDYWRETKDLTYFMGSFRWTGFDYLGESFSWPARTMSFGVIDLAGFPTDSYYLYQSIWSDKPMAHMLPHWTHPGLEGVEIPVVVYTNCTSAELFLNGKSLGEKPMTDELRIIWKVPYSAGELKVVAKTDGEVMATQTYRTAREPYAIAIDMDRSILSANHKDVVHAEITIVDRNGVAVPGAGNLLNFEIEGPARLIGVENGDILDLSPHKVSYRKTFNGKCLAIIQSTGADGDFELKVTSEGLKKSSVKVRVKPSQKPI